MDDFSTLYIFLAESLFFLGVLIGCLKLAANRHRAQLRRVIDHANRYGMMREEALATKMSSDQLRQQLMGQISGLQARLRLLENIEVKYNDLKAKYKQLQEDAGIHESAAPADTTRAEPSLASEFGHQAFSVVNESTDRIADNNRSYQKRIRQQQTTIDSLRDTLQNYQADFSISAINSENKDRAIEKLGVLEKNLRESERDSALLGESINEFQRKLAEAQKRIQDLEAENPDGSSVYSGNKNDEKSYTIVSRSLHEDYKNEEIDLFQAEALANYQRLKQEVEKLRQSTSDQRQVIFGLEKDIKKLSAELRGGDLDPEEQFAKELEMERLQRLLMETEGCVNVLESEVSYLQDKITTLSAEEIAELNAKRDENAELDNYLKSDQIDQLQKVADEREKQLERANIIRGKLRYLISHAGERIDDEVFERVATSVIDAISPLNVDVHIHLKTQFGEIDLANCKGIGKQEVASIAVAMETKEQYLVEGDQEILIAYPKIGAFAKNSDTGTGSLGKIEDSLSFILQIANTVIGGLEERQALKNRQEAIRRFMDGLRRNISQMSVQSRYQSDEARNIINNFTDEISRTIKSLELTEIQEKLVNDMISEVQNRMEILFATDKIMVSDFARLLDRLDSTAGKK